jgi:hypothetical protein
MHAHSVTDRDGDGGGNGKYSPVQRRQDLFGELLPEVTAEPAGVHAVRIHPLLDGGGALGGWHKWHPRAVPSQPPPMCHPATKHGVWCRAVLYQHILAIPTSSTAEQK